VSLTRRGLALFVLMGVVWGIPYLLIKVAVTDLSPPTLAFLRTLIGAAILVPLAATHGELAPLFSPLEDPPGDGGGGHLVRPDRDRIGPCLRRK
jgi:drug/metabolite transporter (DMT)-like permease